MPASSPTLTNCTFTANSAYYGGGMYNNFSSSPTLTNCILWGNVGLLRRRRRQRQSRGHVLRCPGRLHGNGQHQPGPSVCPRPQPRPRQLWGTADDDYGDLRLRRPRPASTPARIPRCQSGITTDLAGNPRFVDVPGIADTGSGTPPIVDMGVYESPDPNLAVAGTDGPDDFSLRLTDDHASIQITGPARSNTYSVLAITSVTFTGGSGADSLTIDFANGDPLPAGGLTFDGGAIQDPGDRLIIKGLTGAAGVKVTSSQVLLAGMPSIGYSHAVVVLDGTNRFSGGATVSGSTLLINSINAIPDGGSLTVGAGTSLFDSSSAGTPGSTSATTATSVTKNAFPLSPVLRASAAADVAKHCMSGHSHSPIMSPTAFQRPQSVPSGVLGISVVDRLVGSFASKTVAGDFAWVRQAASSSDNSDQQRKKDVAILALEAVFSEYGR